MRTICIRSLRFVSPPCNFLQSLSFPTKASSGQRRCGGFCNLRALYANPSFQPLVRAETLRCSDGTSPQRSRPFVSEYLPYSFTIDHPPPPPPPRTLNSCVQGALSSILSAVPADELQPLLEALGDVQLVELMLRLHGDLLPQQCRGSLQEADARRVMSMLVSLLPDMLEPHMRRQLGL